MKFISAVLAVTIIACSAPTSFAQETSPPGMVEIEMLRDVVLGNPDAPVTIEEFASMTCVHCAAFSTDVFPELKTRYIDTGKVRFVLKPFPLDSVSAGAFMLARCGSDDEFYARVEHLFATQKDWLVSDNTGDALLQSMSAFGMDQNTFQQCLTNKEALNWVMTTKEAAIEVVTGTPTFIINGIVSKGNMPIERFADIIEPLLDEAE